MGGRQSLLLDTDFNTADGGVKPGKTITSVEPTTEYQVVTIHPKGGISALKQASIDGLLTGRNVVEDLESVTMGKDETAIYATKPLKEFLGGFDLLDAQGNVLVRMNSDQTQHKWWIYAVGNPTFEGQAPDQRASDKCGEQLFRRARVTVDFERMETFVALVVPASPQDIEEHAGLRMGTISDPILTVQKVAGVKETFRDNYQAFVPIKGKEKPTLSAYWKWNKMLPVPGVKDKIELQAAKGTDMPLLIVLVQIISSVTSSVRFASA